MSLIVLFNSVALNRVQLVEGSGCLEDTDEHKITYLQSVLIQRNIKRTPAQLDLVSDVFWSCWVICR